jgi:hypothetical protein
VTRARAKDLTLAAARNNATWCDVVCRSHGIDGRFASDAWTSPRRTPPFYPDVVTLEPSVIPDGILGRIDMASAGASVKDSFACLDLASWGFEIVHEADWIALGSVTEAGGDPDRAWTLVRTSDELAAWTGAWDGPGAPDGLFRVGLLNVADVLVLAARDEHGVTAGSIVNRTVDVVGVSNVFANDGDLERAWRGCLAEVDRIFPGAPVVGYEAGEELAIARRIGFEPIGPLRIWVAEGEGSRAHRSLVKPAGHFGYEGA